MIIKTEIRGQKVKIEGLQDRSGTRITAGSKDLVAGSEDLVAGSEHLVAGSEDPERRSHPT